MSNDPNSRDWDEIPDDKKTADDWRNEIIIAQANAIHYQRQMVLCQQKIKALELEMRQMQAFAPFCCECGEVMTWDGDAWGCPDKENHE